MQLSRDKVQTILDNAPQGADKKQILDSLIQRGYQLEGVDSAQVVIPTTSTSSTLQSQPSEGGFLRNIGENIKEAVQNPLEVIPERLKGYVPTPRQTEILSGQATDATPEEIAEAKQKIMDFGMSFSPADLGSTLKPITNSIRGSVDNVTNKIRESIPEVNIGETGVGQVVSDIAERVPRAISRGKEFIQENAERAKKIKNSTPEVKNAYKANLDERIINTVTEADDVTKQAYKKVVDLFEETPNSISAKTQPSKISGDLASEQFDLISKQKKNIGEQIGAVTDKLSKTRSVDMVDAYQSIDDILTSQGVNPELTKKGVKLNFSGSKFTPAERTKIQQLYDLATEGGDSLSPLQVREKDQLFSKLKRESNFEGIGDLIVSTPEGNKSMFNVMRDIYSSKLDTLSPEIRALNSEYRKLSQITDDIESSIFKIPNFNATKLLDPAESAKVNLRRIFGEAQSSPAFEAVANEMDAISRSLGYENATPKQVAEFTEYLRKLYPEAVPKTGFQGGIKAGISDVIETISKAGTPNAKDQRKALIELLNTIN